MATDRKLQGLHAAREAVVVQEKLDAFAVSTRANPSLRHAAAVSGDSRLK